MLEVRFGSEIIPQNRWRLNLHHQALRRNRRRVRATIFPNNGAAAVILTAAAPELDAEVRKTSGGRRVERAAVERSMQ